METFRTVDQTIHVSIRCAACGTDNQLTLSRVAPEEKVNCSHCRNDLGLVRELVASQYSARARPRV